MKIKEMWKKFWYLLWEDDSLKGWIFSVVFLFIFIKLIFFPGLSIATGTPLPLAIIESCSMYHEGNLISNFDTWWETHESKYSKFGIEKKDFANFKFKKGLNKGDILFTLRANAKNLKVGDVIIFNANRKNPLIHRIIEIKQENGEYIFSTIGDNNNGQLSIEKNIKEEQLIGRPVFRIAPYFGWGKLIFFEYLRPESERGLCKEN